MNGYFSRVTFESPIIISSTIVSPRSCFTASYYTYRRMLSLIVHLYRYVSARKKTNKYNNCYGDMKRI